MRSILLEGITSREEARALLRNILPGRESPWLLKNTTGDPVAYFDLSETDVDIEGPAVVAEISGRHYDEDENVLEVLRKLQAVVGGRITDAP